MKHAGPATLARISRLLEDLRARPALQEMRPGVFTLGGRPFLHFHDDPTGVFADVRLAREFLRMAVTTPPEQADLLDRIDECLAAVEAHADDERRRGKRR
jgi:hypothetical protein